VGVGGWVHSRHPLDVRGRLQSGHGFPPGGEGSRLTWIHPWAQRGCVSNGTQRGWMGLRGGGWDESDKGHRTWHAKTSRSRERTLTMTRKRGQARCAAALAEPQEETWMVTGNESRSAPTPRRHHTHHLDWVVLCVSRVRECAPLSPRACGGIMMWSFYKKPVSGKLGTSESVYIGVAFRCGPSNGS
jgi:hypothetical protein